MSNFSGEGGTYEMIGGKRVLITPPTPDHPEGNCARDANGAPMVFGEPANVTGAPIVSGEPVKVPAPIVPGEPLKTVTTKPV